MSINKNDKSMKKIYFSILACLLLGQSAAAGVVTTYALSEGETFTSGQKVEVKEEGSGAVVATLVYGEDGGADFNAAQADSHVEGFTAYTSGNGTNGNKAGGTFYTITPASDGTIDVAVVLNASKSFYILEDGTALEGYDGIQADDKYYGTYTFNVKAGSSYKIYCAGSKLGFYGFTYTYGGGDPLPTSGPATFEEMTLGAESYYNAAGVEGETITDSWGSSVTKTQFVSGGYRFTTLFNPAYGSWSGFAVSNTTASTYADWATDQYNNCIGGGYGGNGNFAMVYPSATKETVEPVNGPETISGMYVTNSAWNAQAYLSGDGYTGAFAAGDWCKLTITGTHADESTATLDVYLADYRSDNAADHYYIKKWQWVDLTPLGEVKSLTFEITSNHANDWGMTTPGYFCMDNFGGEPDESAGICQRNATAAATATAYYTIDGKRLTAPQRGINLVRMSDGTTRKVVY